MGDVAERAAMDEGRIVLDGLDEVGLDRLGEQDSHRAVRLEIARGHRALVAAIADDDPGEPLAQILDILGEAEDRHDLRGDGDVEARFARKTIADAAERLDDLPERAVVHVDTRFQTIRRTSMPSALPQWI